MTLPSNSTIPAIEFNNFDAMSYASNTRSLIDNAYHFRPITNQQQQHQQHQQQHQQQTHQQRLVSRLEQQQQLQHIQAPIPPPLPQQQHQQQLSQGQQTQHFQSTTNVATAAATVFSSLELAVENVMPGIYLTKNFIAWNEENLRAHGFTHIIIIDKHIQELYYPSPVFKLSTQTEANTADAFDTYEYYCQPSSLSFGKEFEAIDLNFGEKSYLTTVLPNCYRAVKFINKALQSGGTILVIDCNGGEQKCLTIIVAYLMYKHNINFSNAFARLKGFYKKADLDRFYMNQLYEYEPILQVQRAQSRGHSCSRELHSAILKRKKTDDDVTCVTDVEDCNGNTEDDTNGFFDTLNPLSHFNTNTTQQEQLHQRNEQRRQMNAQQFQQRTSSANQQQQQLSSTYTSNFHTLDDYSME